MRKTIYILFASMLLFGSLSSCNTPEPNPPVTKNFCGVPPDMMIQLIRNYKTQVWSKTSDTAAGKYDARFVEISLEQMENFIAYAKQAAEHDNLNVTSFRIYYINYPGEKKTQAYLAQNHTGNVFEDYSGCHSLAMVPVVGNNIHDPERTDYYKEGMVAANGPVPADFATARTAGNIFVPNNCSSTSNMENHNELCPPFTGCEHKTLIEIADR